MPGPVNEETFIDKADALIGAVSLVAARLAVLSGELADLKVNSNLNAGQMAARMERLAETVTDTASQMNQLEIARIKRVPARHGSADGTL